MNLKIKKFPYKVSNLHDFHKPFCSAPIQLNSFHACGGNTFFLSIILKTPSQNPTFPKWTIKDDERWCPVRTAQSQYPLFSTFIWWNANRCFFDFHSFEFVFFCDIRKPRIIYDGWHETLILLHVSGCEMVHFVTSYVKQNKDVNKLLRVSRTDWKSPLNVRHFLCFKPVCRWCSCLLTNFLSLFHSFFCFQCCRGHSKDQPVFSKF